MTVNEKIASLRKLMKEQGIKAYIIPSADPHMSEYVADHWKSRAWISGFNGSAGTVVVTDKESGLWTDGRYFLQAEKQLEGSEIKLFKMGLPETPTYIEWIADKLQKGDTAGFNGEVVSVSAMKDMKSRFENKEIKIDARFDFIKELWADRQEIPATTVIVHEKQYAGLAAAEKIAKVREELNKAGAECYVLSSLDDIAWLFNIRAEDVSYVPVAISYAIITSDSASLFINDKRLSEAAVIMLKDNGVTVEPYEAIEGRLGSLGSCKLAYDPARTNCKLLYAINNDCKKLAIDEITAKLKAVKNPVEIENIRNCQVKDGVAMVQFLSWLDENIGKEAITELTVEEKLVYFRGLQDKNMGPSFKTIAGYADHGAVIHYGATEETSYTLENKGLMIIDSGGQYLDGTTDITRTVVFANPTEEEKRDFTLVLKSHIALATARFLYGTTGSNLDVLPRYPLWNEGLNYRHGTGHGVGYFLSVHEGPQSVSSVMNKVVLEPGMLLTDEPGLYTDGKHGVRTENILLVVNDEKTNYGQFLKFETLTLCPIDLRGIEPALLTAEEKEWLNDYHSLVYDKLSPYLDEKARKWLKKMTAGI